MVKRILIIAILLFSFGILYFMWSARLAKKKSDDILSKFKEIDSSLKKSDNSISTISTDKLQDKYMIASARTNLLLYIDSLLEFTSINPSDLHNPLSKKQIGNLKHLILTFNSAVRQAGNVDDTIFLAPMSDKSISKKWEDYFSSDATKSATYTYLVLLKNRVLKT